MLKIYEHSINTYNSHSRCVDCGMSTSYINAFKAKKCPNNLEERMRGYAGTYLNQNPGNTQEDLPKCPVCQQVVKDSPRFEYLGKYYHGPCSKYSGKTAVYNRMLTELNRIMRKYPGAYLKENKAIVIPIDAFISEPTNDAR